MAVTLTNEEKIYKIEEFFWKNFIKVEGDTPESNAGNCIPYTTIHVVSGNTEYAEINDGTINIAEAMTYQWIKDKANLSDVYESPLNIGQYLSTIQRLVDKAFSLYSDNWFVESLNKQSGFFLRDDIDNPNFKSSYNMLKQSLYEDPCHSPFVSQDQVWNLNPILYKIASEQIDTEISAQYIGLNINYYIADNGYKIYNPYLSELVHFYTYCPTFNTNKVPADERQEDRLNNYKPTIKVKRGAYNWYYSGGTKAAIKAFEALDSDESPKYRSIRELCYKGIVFFLDRIYEPVYRLFTGDDFKHNSYYCYAATSGIWYSKKFKKRFLKRFNKSLTSGDIFEANLVPLVLDKDSGVDTESLLAYLNDEIDNYYNDVVSAEGDTDSNEYIFSSPIYLLILWYFYKYITSEA